jgi:hypothetical protein
MKKILVLLATLLSISPVFGQIKYGIKGGETVTDQTWEVVPRFAHSVVIDSRKGINLGVFAEFSEDKYVGIVAEINYRQKGANISLVYTGRDTSGLIVVPKNLEHKLTYLNISLLGKVKYEFPYITPYLITGLKTDYQLSNKLEDEDLGFIATESSKQIWGLVLGGGFELRDLLPVVILGEFRYEFDFNKIYAEDQFQFKTNTFEFRIGIKF